jgi:hypothetical protein
MSAIDETKNHSGEIFILFDRYLKANNNFLPLQAYLQYLESENFDGFTSICHYKSLLKDLDPSDSLNKLTQFGKPIWWYSLHRLVNTLTLFALTFALYSGRMMDSKWLPEGELNHFWYYAHLLSWLIMVVCLVLHLLMTAKVGGVPLLLSILKWGFREQDSPKLWLSQLRQWGLSLRLANSFQWLQSLNLYKVLEIVVLLAIIAAWIIPKFD